MQEIFASKERQEVLDDFGVKYSVDMELNFIFPDMETERRAVNLLKDALEL